MSHSGLVWPNVSTCHLAGVCISKDLFWLPRVPPIVKTYCYAVEVQSQSLAGDAIAMREPCTNPLHCRQSSKLRIRLLRMLLESLWGMTFSA